jgi:hypothetical protein
VTLKRQGSFVLGRGVPRVQLREIIERIRAFAPRISSGTVSGARFAPEASAWPTECFANAERKAQQAGGSALHCWMFHYREVAAMPGPGYLIAVNHAVWCAPDKKLVDVTPFHSDPKHHPIVLNRNAVLYLTDSNATPLTNGGGILTASYRGGAIAMRRQDRRTERGTSF